MPLVAAGGNLNPTGRNQHTKNEDGVGNTNHDQSTGNTALNDKNHKTYILRRLARERPDLLERYERATPDSPDYIDPAGGGDNNPYGCKGKPKKGISDQNLIGDSGRKDHPNDTSGILRRLARGAAGEVYQNQMYKMYI